MTNPQQPPAQHPNHHENALRQLGVNESHLQEFRARGINFGQVSQWISLLLPVILQIIQSAGGNPQAGQAKGAGQAP
jgi:hypothetical protein